MDSVVEKFIKYLEELTKNKRQGLLREASQAKLMGSKDTNEEIIAQSQDIIEEIAEIKRVIRILSIPKMNWDLYAEVYIDFNILSEMLKKSPLKSREQLYVIFYMLEKNLATPILTESAGGFDAPALETYEFKTMTTEEARSLIHSQEYGRLAKTDDSELSDEERSKFAELKEFIDNNPLDLTYIRELHQNISMHYFEKKENFDYDDVKAILCVLESFGVDKGSCESFKVILNKEVKKREPKEEIVVVSDFHKKLDEKRVSEKEYNLLNRELKKYFDLDNMVSVQPLDLELQIYAVNLMIRMGITEEIINKALKAMNRDNKLFKDIDNPLVIFNRIYGKLSYYEDNEELQESVNKLMEFFQEIFICNDDDYEFWKSMIGEELDTAISLLPNGYEYEIEEAKKLVKLNK